MTRIDRKRALRKDFVVAAILTLAGMAVSGASLAAIAGHPMQLAQATPPLQSTPGAENKPAEPNTTTTGPRPNEAQPQPARPDSVGQSSGASTALPPAPAEKMAPPVQTK